MSKRFAVIGLGRYGSRFAKSLAKVGAEVIAIDLKRSLIEEIRDDVTVAVALDSTDEQALRHESVDQVHTAVVSIGNDFEANILTTVILQSMNIPRIISRVANPTQATILERIGAHIIVNPEEEAADRWAQRLMMPHIIEHIELAENYGLAQMVTPKPWIGETLADLDLRQKYHVNIVAIKRSVSTISEETGQTTIEERIVDLPLPTSRLAADDILIIAGDNDAIEKLPT